MKSKIFRQACQLSTVLCATAVSSLAHAQWLTHTGSGNATTSTFSGVGGAYSGTVQTSLTVINDGGNNGIVGLSPGSTTALTPAFLTHYPTNSPGGTYNYLNLAYNHTRDAYRVNIDFSGLQGGMLPAGTFVTLGDLDIWEVAGDMQAYDQSGLIPPFWLAQRAGLAGWMDYSSVDGYLASPTPIGVFNSMFGMRYDFVGIAGNENSSLAGFITTLDIRRIEFTVSKWTGGDFAHNGGFGMGFAAPVPEPTSLAVVALGAATLFRHRRSRRHRN